MVRRVQISNLSISNNATHSRNAGRPHHRNSQQSKYDPSSISRPTPTHRPKPAHPPHPNAILAFSKLSHTIKRELIKLRHHWDKHEPRMFENVSGVNDDKLGQWDVEKDLVLVRSGPTSYGTIIFGKLRLPSVSPDAYIHVRIHDPPGEAQEDVKFHAIWTDEKREEGRIMGYQCVVGEETELEWFDE